MRIALLLITITTLFLSGAMNIVAGTNVSPYDDQIIWVRVNNAPFYICDENETCSGGFAYEIEQMLRSKMPEHEHRAFLMNLKRASKLMREGVNVCAPFLIRTPEREQFMAFSIPSMALFPNSVIVRSDDDRFSGTKSVSLAHLLNNATLRGGVSVARSYGTTIDSLLAPHKGSRALYVSFGRGVLKDQLKQLFAKRVDYIIGYPMEAAYITSHFGNNQTTVSIPISETAGAELVASVACADTSAGREIIEKINTILRTARPTDRYFHFFTPYVAPQDMESFRELFHSRLLQ